MAGVFNFRDIGGLETTDGQQLKQGLVFRADGLHRAPDEERNWVHQRGIRQVIDLRSSTELENDGRFQADGVAFDHIPIVERLAEAFADMEEASGARPDDFLYHHYLKLVRDNGSAFASALELVATSLERDHPVVYHCTAGKDRTGILTALILAGLGVEPRVVAEDYARSTPAVRQMVAWYRDNEGGTPADRMQSMGMDPAMAEVVMASEPTTMLGLLAGIQRNHGGIDQYLAAIGGQHSIKRIADRLLHQP